MAKVQNLSDIQQEIAFTEFDFYRLYERTLQNTEPGRMKRLLPLRERTVRVGLIEEHPRSLRIKRGRKSFFTPEGKVALMFLKMHTDLSAPRLMEALNVNIHYQIFCGIRISPENQLTNYKLIDSIALELSKSLRIQKQQQALADIWKPYVKNLDTVHTDAACYEGGQGGEFGAKCSHIRIDGISFIKKLSFNAFNEGTRLKHCVALTRKLTGVPVRNVGGDHGYAGNANRSFCSGKGIEASFAPKGRKGGDEVKSPGSGIHLMNADVMGAVVLNA